MNIRDMASINELAILSNLETMNAQMIREGLPKEKRFLKLSDIAEYQLNVLNDKDFIKSLKKLDERTFVDQQKKLKKR